MDYNAKEEELKWLIQVINETTPCQFKDIIGESSILREARAAAEAFSDSDENILLIGESGTGKELFAQAIHNHRCPNGPFVPVNCAALSRELAENELFDYESRKVICLERAGLSGKIELAEGGTLFLDEIGDMSLSSQAMLMKILEDKQIICNNKQRIKNVNFTIVATTKKDLFQMVRNKKFREDLYYRLSIFSVLIPPLRYRQTDSLLLSRYFVEKYCWKQGCKPLTISRKLEQEILTYDWPGNIRQLNNAMIFAIHNTKGEIIKTENMPIYITSKQFGFSGSNANKSAAYIHLKNFEKVAGEMLWKN